MFGSNNKWETPAVVLSIFLAIVGVRSCGSGGGIDSPDDARDFVTGMGIGKAAADLEFSPKGFCDTNMGGGGVGAGPARHFILGAQTFRELAQTHGDTANNARDRDMVQFASDIEATGQHQLTVIWSHSYIYGKKDRCIEGFRSVSSSWPNMSPTDYAFQLKPE